MTEGGGSCVAAGWSWESGVLWSQTETTKMIFSPHFNRLTNDGGEPRGPGKSEESESVGDRTE